MDIGKKIRELRERAQLTQRALSGMLYCDASRLSRIESGDVVPSDELIEQIKSALGVAGLPFTEAEVEEHRALLAEWRVFLRRRSFSDADRIWGIIEKIPEVPCETEINLLQTLYTVRYLCLYERLTESGRLMVRIGAGCTGSANGVIVYEYHYVCAILLILEGRNFEAARHLLAAHKLTPRIAEADEGFYRMLGNCCNSLDMPSLTISYLESAWERAKLDNNDVSHFVYYVCGLAPGYAKSGCYLRATALLTRGLEAVSVMGGLYKAVILHNFGDLYLRSGDPDKALDYFDKAHELYPAEYTSYVYNNMLFKTYALFAAGRLSEAEKLLTEGIGLTDETTVTGVLFRALRCSRNLSDKACLAHLETVAIPRLISFGKKLKVIEYCEQLEALYLRRGAPRKAAAYTRLQRDLYRAAMFGEDLNEEKMDTDSCNRLVYYAVAADGDSGG